jgi:hypothetical protein
VRLRPAALRIDAMRMMHRPIIKATTGFNGFGGISGSDASMTERDISENVVEVVNIVVGCWSYELITPNVLHNDDT